MSRAMQRLALYLDSVLEPGTPVVALTFWCRDRQAVFSRESAGLRGAAALYLWPARKSPPETARNLRQAGHLTTASRADRL